MTATADCLICREHRGEIELPGGARVDDDLVVAFHVLPLEQERTYLGHLLVTPRRHAPGLDDLTDDEAAAIGVPARSPRPWIACDAPLHSIERMRSSTLDAA